MSSGPFRLEAGGRLDRSRPVSFTFDGRRLAGFGGDTLASALLANGVQVVARSFKFHRPRGVMTAGVEEPNALLRIATPGSTIPLVRATLQPLVEGLIAASENCFPRLDFDLGRVFDLTHRFWPAGFYNKTFMWPGWHWYETWIRRVAGLGTLPSGEDSARYFEHNLHCDVLVVGGGAAGLAAATAAAQAGARVVLAEQDTECGGNVVGAGVDIDGQPADAWIKASLAELGALSQVRMLRRTQVSGLYDHGVATAIDQSDADHPGGRIERFWRIRAREIVLATGAIEQPLVFAHNDRPGIMLAGAAQTYLNRYGVAVGRNVLVATNNDSAYRTAFDLHEAGVAVAAIVDARERAGDAVREEAVRRGLRVEPASRVTRTAGRTAVARAWVSRLDADGSRSGRELQIDCDAIAMSSGWNPTVHLYSHAGGTVRYDPTLGCLVPIECRQRLHIVGAANAEFSLGQAIASGTEAGALAAAEALGTPGAVTDAPNGRSTMRTASTRRRDESFALRVPVRADMRDAARSWIDFQHDVTLADVELAVRENFVSVEHMKRYTTIGMAADQGKTSNLNALVALGDLTGRAPADVGTTTFRPPYMPVTLGAIAGGACGALYSAARVGPAHRWHEAHGAIVEDYGGWRRPAYYARDGETRETAIRREALAVRGRLGLFDASPLGKIELRGPDAANFLDRIYVNNIATLRPGGLRYGLMLNENGVVIDDGVCARLAPDHFVVSTTAANGERIAAWLEEWHQCEWPDLDFVMLPVTTQWGVVVLAGAAARSLLQELDGDIDLSATEFPHMCVRSGTLAGSPARVQRVSFTGELGYEISVPADRVESLWDELMRRGARHGIEAVGIEAWLQLRIEKGYLHVGTDTDSTTTPLDLGLGRLVDTKTVDFIGRRSLARPADRRADRRQLVALESVGAGTRLAAGAHIVSGRGAARRSEGFVTSACLSTATDLPIGLGLVERGASRTGELVQIFDEGRIAEARIVTAPFFDPDGSRARG